MKQGLVFSTMAILLVLPFVITTAQSSRCLVSGYVIDSISGEKLPGADVESSIGKVTTNAEGFYSLLISSGLDTLTTYHVGYRCAITIIESITDITINVELFPGEELKGAIISARESFIDGKNLVYYQNIVSTPSFLSEPDLFKTLQHIPGVQSSMDGSAGLIVRGGGPDENLILLDGIPLYDVSHMLGLFTAFPPESINKVTFYKGSFPARFGERISSVVDIKTNDGDIHSFRGTLSLGILNSRIHLEGPLIEGKTTASFSARGMNSTLISPILETFGSDYDYYFFDVSGKIVHHFSPIDKLSFSFYKCRDYLSHNNEDTVMEENEKRYLVHDGAKIQWGHTLFSANWSHSAENGLNSVTSIAWYEFDTNSIYQSWKMSSNETNEEYTALKSAIQDYIFKTDFVYTTSPILRLYSGLFLTHHHFIPSFSSGINSSTIDASNEQSQGTDYHGTEFAIYLEDELSIVDRIHINTGLRYTYMTTDNSGYPSIQPRIVISANIPNSVILMASYSRLSQYVHLLSLSQLSLPTDMWIPITNNIRPIISDQYCLGISYNNISGFETGIEGYYKHTQNVLEYRNGVSFADESNNWDEMVEMGEASSKGLEFFIKAKSEKVKGTICYTLSKTDRRFTSINNGEWFPYHYDRTHSFIVDFSYRFNANWDIAASWSFSSGNRITIPSRAILTGTSLSFSSVYQIASGYLNKNNYTLPPTHHLDLSINWQRKLKFGYQTLSFSIYNVYNAMNPNIVMFVYDVNNEMSAKAITYLPVIPSLSYTFKF